MDGADGLTLVLPVRVVVVRIGPHGTRPVERENGRDVDKGVRTQGAQQSAHRPTVELEDAQGVATAEQLVGGLVIQGQGGQVQQRSAVGGNGVDQRHPGS